MIIIIGVNIDIKKTEGTNVNLLWRLYYNLISSLSPVKTELE